MTHLAGVDVDFTDESEFAGNTGGGHGGKGKGNCSLHFFYFVLVCFFVGA